MKKFISFGFSDGRFVGPATETSDGVTTYICTICGETKIESIEKLEHTHTFSDKWSSDETNH